MTDLDTLEALAGKATPINGYSTYLVTECGQVISTMLWRGQAMRLLQQSPNSHGYMRVKLTNPNKNALVHKLVADAYLETKPSGQYQLRHLDGDKSNNEKLNLAWGTAKDNADDRDLHGKTYRGEANGFSKLSDEVTALIKQDKRPRAEIAAQYGVCKKTVSNIRVGKRWSGQ